MEYEAETTFSKLSDDVVLKIFTLLEDHPRSWACLSCVCTKFNSLISSICYKSKCASSLSSDLLSLSKSHDGCSWSSLFKLSVCCPGLYHCGVLLDNSDFGLHREIGSDSNSGLSVSSTVSFSSSSSQVHHQHHHDYCTKDISRDDVDYRHQDYHSINGSRDDDDNNNDGSGSSSNNNNNNNMFEGWSLYDDLYFDTVYDNSETSTPVEITTGVVSLDTEFTSTNKRRKVSNNNDSAVQDQKQRSHLATGAWNLSREQGLKLLASRFRDDCLYISDWPGCVHNGNEDENHKRSYMLFRGFFNNFKKTRVWRTINDGGSCRSKVDINCAFCKCKETWDLHSAFCLKRGFGFHDDGEPVVRAYVCENGHVSGAWTDFPLYT